MPKVPPKKQVRRQVDRQQLPAGRSTDPRDDPAVRKAKNTDALAAAFPANKNKPNEYGRGRAEAQAGRHRGAGRSGR